MATCFDCQDNTPRTDAPVNFWRGLALGVSIWVLLVGALVIA